MIFPKVLRNIITGKRCKATKRQKSCHYQTSKTVTSYCELRQI